MRPSPSLDYPMFSFMDNKVKWESMGICRVSSRTWKSRAGSGSLIGSPPLLLSRKEESSGASVCTGLSHHVWTERHVLVNQVPDHEGLSGVKPAHRALPPLARTTAALSGGFLCCVRTELKYSKDFRMWPGMNAHSCLN